MLLQFWLELAAMAEKALRQKFTTVQFPVLLHSVFSLFQYVCTLYETAHAIPILEFLLEIVIQKVKIDVITGSKTEYVIEF